MNKETYTLLAKRSLGGIALLVYARDRTVTGRVVDVRVAQAGCGIGGLMGNKGGVGVRVVLADEEEEEEDEGTGSTVFTFLTAHLAAHDSGLQRRNEDWRNLVQRVVFQPGEAGESEQFRIAEGRRKDVFKGLRRMRLQHESKGIQLYDTSYLFVFGVSLSRAETRAELKADLRCLDPLGPQLSPIPHLPHLPLPQHSLLPPEPNITRSHLTPRARHPHATAIPRPHPAPPARRSALLSPYVQV